MKMSFGSALVKGAPTGLACAFLIAVIRYIIDGGNGGDFIHQYLLSPIGKYILIGLPVAGVLYYMFCGKDSNSNKDGKY